MIVSRLFHILPFIIFIGLALFWYILYKVFGSKVLLDVAIALDQTANACFGGSPYETISSRLGRKIKDRQCKPCKILCKVLSWFFNEDYHCISSIGK